MLDNDEMIPVLIPYYESLDRLDRDEPQVVPKGTRISKKAVCLEAGKSESSIKKNRSIFFNLIERIDIKAEEQRKRISGEAQKLTAANQRHKKSKAAAEDFKALYEEALVRELLLLAHLDKLERQLGFSRNVIPFDSRRNDND
ncbi:TPA: hypothetical protein ACSQMU_005251 [Pseudomonas aeruginosa]|nr:hypothetical protein [Pseudomonas aeruginosa]